MRNRWPSVPGTARIAVSIALIGAFAAACSSASTPTPSPVATPSAVAPASASASASPSGSVAGVSASPSASASAMASESASPAVASSPMSSSDLATSIPKQVGSKSLTVKSTTAADLPMFTGDAGKAALAALIASLKTTPDQVQAALGMSSDKSVTIAAISIGGVDATAVQNGIYSVLAATAKGVNSSPTTVSGKSVTQIQNADTPKVTIYLYTKDSAVYVIWVNDQADGQDALSKLP